MCARTFVHLPHHSCYTFSFCVWPVQLRLDMRVVRSQCAPCHRVRASAIHFHHFSWIFCCSADRQSWSQRPIDMRKYIDLIVLKRSQLSTFLLVISQTISNWIWKCGQKEWCNRLKCSGLLITATLSVAASFFYCRFGDLKSNRHIFHELKSSLFVCTIRPFSHSDAINCGPMHAASCSVVSRCNRVICP